MNSKYTRTKRKAAVENGTGSGRSEGTRAALLKQNQTRSMQNSQGKEKCVILKGVENIIGSKAGS